MKPVYLLIGLWVLALAVALSVPTEPAPHQLHWDGTIVKEGML